MEGSIAYIHFLLMSHLKVKECEGGLWCSSGRMVLDKGLEMTTNEAFSVDHFQAVYNTSSPGNTGIHRQCTVHVSVRVYATFAHSVGNGLLCTLLGNTMSK